MKPRILNFVICLTILFPSLGHSFALDPEHRKSEPARMPVDKFIQQIFVHGVPFHDAVQYRSDAEAVPFLIEVLKDSTQKALWSNTIVTLGIIGSDNATRAIIEFIERSSGDLSLSHVRVKKHAAMSLGLAINRPDNNQKRASLACLTNLIKPEIYAAEKNLSARQATGTCSNVIEFSKNGDNLVFENNLPNLKDQLRQGAILGLGLSGIEEARKPLEVLLSSDEAKIGSRFRALVLQALKTHNSIMKVGLACYHDKNSPTCKKGSKRRTKGYEPLLQS